MGGVVKTQVVKYIRKGEKGEKGDNAINIVLSPQTVILKKGVSERKFVGVELYDGPEKIPYNNDGNSPGFQCSVLNYYAELPEGLGWSFTCDPETKAFSYIIRHSASAENVNAEIKFYAEYNGIKYESKIIVKTVADGEKGATLRGPQAWSDCAVGYNFKAGKSGEEWKDVVLYSGNYYSCVKSHAKTDSNYPGSTTDTNSGYWQLGDKVELVATKILLATYALVENLGVTAIDMKDSSGNVLFQAKDGNVICKTGTFTNVDIKGRLTGSVRNPFVLAGDSIDTDYSDNVVMLSNGSGGWVSAFSLPWSTEQSGRRITIANYRWGATIASGQAGISAPSGKYFFENGIRKSTLNISREAIELLGYGTSSAFYGWIVMKRTDIMTDYKYGHPLKSLATGTVTAAGGISYKTFDGSTLSVTKSASSKGHYIVNMPSGWFSQESHCFVMLTGVGFVDGSTTAACKATLVSKTTTSFTVCVSDDASLNDNGAFNFMIFNTNDWL